MVLLIGSLSQYFDSAFNGFSLPQRRWVYFLSISTSILIALYIQYLSELTLKQYLLVAIPVFIFGLYHYIFASAYVNWMIVPLFLIIVLIFVVWKKQWLYQPYILIAIVLLFFVQQIIMTHDSRARTIDPYATTTKTLTDSSYYNHKLAKN